MSAKMYFAHPLNIYDTPLERRLIKVLEYEGSVQIINPNTPEHQLGYDAYAKRKDARDLNHKGMNYFYDEVLPKCDGCFAVAYKDERLGSGVAGEARWFVERGLPVTIVVPVSATLFGMHLLLAWEEKALLKNDPEVVVPHEETRLRTWKVYSKIKRSYNSAHKVRMPVPEGFYVS